MSRQSYTGPQRLQTLGLIEEEVNVYRCTMSIYDETVRYRALEEKVNVYCLRSRGAR